MHEPQTEHRLFWLATYHDGTIVDEREAPGEISSESIDRRGLARFEMVDEDGAAHPFVTATGDQMLGLDFPETDDPRLVYRRRSFINATDQDKPRWTYIAGLHHSDDKLELWGMGADGVFRLDPEAEVELVPCEQF